MQVDVDDVLGTHERDLHRNIRRIRLDGETGNVIGKVEFSLPLSAPLCPSVPLSQKVALCELRNHPSPIACRCIFLIGFLHALAWLRIRMMTQP